MNAQNNRKEIHAYSEIPFSLLVTKPKKEKEKKEKRKKKRKRKSELVCKSPSVIQFIFTNNVDAASYGHREESTPPSG